MAYHDNPVINDIMLTVINDGNGDQCGMTYKQRCAAVQQRGLDYGLGDFRIAVKTYNQKRIRDGGRGATRKELFEAAELIQNYYREYVKEL